MRNVYGSVFSALMGVMLVGMVLIGTSQEAKAQCAVEFVNCPNDTIIYPPFPPEICDALIQVNTPSAVFVETVPGDCSGFGPITVTQLTGPTSGTYPVGVYTVIFVASSTDGVTTITDTCTYTITIADTVPPTITRCPGDIVIYNDPDTCGAVATWVAPTASDACGIASFTSNYESGDFFPTGTTMVVYTATDNSGNTSECTFEVTVLDTTVPVITFCPGDTVYTLDPADACPFYLVLPEIVIEDDCADEAFITATGATTFAIVGTDASEFYNVGVTTVEVFVDDGSGNTAFCSFTVEIIDNTPPVINCSAADITVNNDAGLCEATVNVPTVTATDNCSYTITNDYNAQSSVDAPLNVVDVFPVGMTTILFTVTDEGGNTATCTIDVFVNDTENPTIDCSAAGSPILTDTDPGVCYATISFNVTATDNCGYTITNDYNAQTSTNATLSFTDQFAPGSYTVTFTATDTSGNTATCSVSITVEDNEAPVINCVSITLPTDPGVCETDSVWSYPAYTDNCDPNPTLTHIFGPLPGDILTPAGSPYVVFFEVEDADGNMADCLFLIFIQDEEGPVVTCDPAAPASIDLDANCQGTVPDVVTGSSATDNCDDPIDILITQDPVAGTVITGHQTVTITVTAMDLSGNTSTCSIDIDYNDVTPPTVTCQADPMLTTSSNGTGNCTGGGSFPAIQIQDNCQFYVTSHVVNESGDTIASFILQGPFSAPTPVILNFTFFSFPLGVNQVHYTITDEGGNTATCIQTVTVIDDEDPTISCPGPIVQDTDPDTCGAVLMFTVTATDNCSYTITNDFNAQSSNNGDLVFNDFVPQSVTSIIFTATDTAGNTATCAVSITIVDTQAPYLTCPADIFTNTLNSSVCYDIVTWNPPLADDNCAGIVINQQTTSWPNPGLYAANDWKAPYVVAYYAEDASGNTATCSFTITVYDTVRPQFTGCPTDATIPYDASDCVTEYNWTPPVGSDNCSGLIVTSTHAPGFSFQIGTTTVAYTARDSSGNTAVCSFDVTVVDTVPPTIMCHNDTTLFNDLDECGAIYSWMEPEVADDCDTVTITLRSTVEPYQFVGGSYADTVILNIYMIPGTMTNDNVTLTIYHRGDIDALSERFNVHGEDFSLLGLTNNGGQCNPVYTQTTFVLSAAQFNAWAVDGQVTIILAPISTAINNICAPNQDAYASVMFDEINITRTQTGGLASGSMFPVGTDTIIYEVTDAYGNVTTCSWVVTVVDTQAPYLECIDEVTVFNDPGQCNAFIDLSSCIQISGYTGYYHTDNWTYNVTGTGSVDSSAAPGSVSLLGSDGGSGNYQETRMGITIPCDGELSFSWDYETFDVDGPGFDPFGYVVNGVVTQLTDSSGPLTQSGTVTISLNAGDVFDFLQWSTDDVFGAAVTITAQFSAPATVSGAWDNCGIASLTNDYNGTADASDTYPVGTTTVTFTAVDVNGNISTCSFDVIVIDNEPPVAICQNQTVFLNSAGNASVTVAQINNGSSDNCGIDNITLSQSNFTCADVGVNVITMTVTDIHGNTATCSATVTVIDNMPPMALCQNITLALDSNGMASITVADIDNGSWDNCGIDTMWLSQYDFDCTDLGNNSVTLFVLDVNGNLSFCTANVNVIDDQAPVALCQDITVYLDNNGNATITANDVDDGSYDNCTIVSRTIDVSTFDCDDVGSHTVTLTVTDQSGNTSTCTSTVTVVDSTRPFLVCPSSLIANNAFGMCGNAIQGLNLGFLSDNCGIDTFWNDWTGTQSANAFYPVGVTTVTYYAIDVNGNTGTCSFTVTIIDFERPTLTCPGNITVTTDPGDCGAIVDYTVTVFDNCLGDSLYQTAGLPSGSFFPVGTTYNEFLAVDASGNTSTCGFNVTVNDNEAPVITNCSADITVPNGAGTCGADVFFGTPMASDNCPGVTITLTSGLASGSFFPVGTTNNVYTATDASGNTAVCTFTVTVLDVEAPTIECLPDMVVSNDSGDCGAVVTFPGLLLSENFETFTLCTPSAFGICPLTNGWINATDDNQDWRVYSGPTPSFNTGPSVDQNPGTSAGKYLFMERGVTGWVANLVSPSMDLTASTSTTLEFWYHMFGSTMGTMHVDVSTDGMVTWTNNIVPSWTDNINLWQKKTVSLDAYNGLPNVRFRIRGIYGTSFLGDKAVDNFKVYSNAVPGQPLFADNCPGATIAQTTGLPSGSFFPVGTTTNTFVVTDASGNTASCSFTVTVEDTEPPIIACPMDTVLPNDPGECFAVFTYPDATATDNCGIASLNQTGGLVSGSQFPVGMNSVTYAAIDIHGNVSQCTFTVTVEDVEVPVITCPADIIVDNDSAMCGADVAILSPTIIENCLFTLTNSYNGTTNASDFYPVGTTTVVFTITDQGGNTATCSMDVTVNDIELPMIVCPGDTTMPNDTGFCGALVIFDLPVASDNCPGVTFAQTAGLPSLSLYPVGVTTNIFTATDASGNTSTCSFDVTILDLEAPEFIFCPDPILTQNDPGLCGAVVFWLDPIAFDNCIDFTMTSNYNSGDTMPVGTTTVIYTATDSAGNTSQCMFNVTVVDVEAPTFTFCPQNIGSCDPVVTWNLPIAADNCAVVSLTSTHASGSTFPIGTTTVVYTAADAAGNTATCSFEVTVHPLPVANAGFDVAVCLATGATIGGNPTGSAGTSPYTYSWAPAAGLNSSVAANPVASPAATTNYTVTVTDANGCQATDEVTVTVRPLPTANAGADQTICFGQSVVIGGTPAGSGTVGPYLYSWSPTAGLSSANAANPTASPATTTTYILTVTDAFGCQGVDQAVVTVNPLPNATITPAGPFCRNDAAVNLAAATAGGTWSGNGITNAAAGTFNPGVAGTGTHLITYSVTDANGCFNSATTTITVLEIPNSRILPAGPFCETDAPVFLAGIPNLNPHTWAGTGITNTATGQFSPAVAGSGNHTITYIVTNANGCTDSATIVITVNASPFVSINSAGPYCESEPVQVLTANISGGIWSGPGIIQSQLGQFLPVAASAGVHHIVYTFTQSATGCTSRDTTQITVFEVPAISSSVTNASCPDASNGAIDITVTGGSQPYSYQWSNGGNTQDLTGIAAGTYRVTVTDANGCTQTAAVTVGISTNPVSVTAIITPAWSPAISNGAINVTVTGGVPPYTFQWSNGATTEDVDGLLPGTYQLVVVDAAGCSYLFFYNVPADGGVNVDLVDLERNISLYPNPTSDVVNIDIEVGGNVVDLTMTVFDVLGRTMYVTHHNFSGKLTETISTSTWASGHYMVRFNVDGQQLTKKFIVTK